MKSITNVCSDSDCNTKILGNAKKNQCRVCLSMFCTSLCLINHLTAYHKEKKTQSPSQENYLTGEIIPLHATSQNEAFYNIENFDKVMTSSKKYQVLGSGGFSTVYLVKHKKTGAYYALKEMNKTSLHNLIDDKVIRREMEIHITLSHENICKLYAYREDKDNFYMIMDYESNGNLFTEIQKEKNNLSEERAFAYFIEICSAVAFLHTNGIIHRDIKPENCLLDKNKKLKLCDFGWTTDIIKPRTTFCGTFEYMAPEIIQNSPYTKSVDIWSLGILLYELLHGYSPFRNCNFGQEKTDLNSNAKEIMKNIIRNQLVFQPNQYSSEVKDLITKLLNPEYKKRITIKEIFNHPWIKNNIQNTSVSIPSSRRDSTIIKEGSLYDNSNLFDTICGQLSKRNKIISPIDHKTDYMESFSLYKEMKEIEKEIEAKSNEINNFKLKTDRILNQPLQPIAPNSLTNDSSTCNTTSIKNVLFANCSLIANEDNLCPRKPKKKILNKKTEQKDKEKQLVYSEISTQTEINLEMQPESNCKAWDLLSIFKCGR